MPGPQLGTAFCSSAVGATSCQCEMETDRDMTEVRALENVRGKQFVFDLFPLEEGE